MYLSLIFFIKSKRKTGYKLKKKRSERKKAMFLFEKVKSKT